MVNQYKNSNIFIRKMLIKTLNDIDATIFVDKNNLNFFDKIVKIEINLNI